MRRKDVLNNDCYNYINREVELRMILDFNYCQHIYV